jgi:Domain of unknown function (DUF4389)
MEAQAQPQHHPIRLVVNDDLRRNRLTVFFRLLLAIPHFIWFLLWGIIALLALIVNWFATLFAGRSPAGLHGFLAAYVRYVTHVSAFVTLAANPFPGFTGAPGYPVDVEIAPPEPQNRWITGFRVILAVPALLVGGALLGSGGGRSGSASFAVGLAGAAAFLGWFAALARARMPGGLRDAIAYALSYSAQVDSYLFLLTDRYPNADPLAALGRSGTPEHPIALACEDDLERSRLTVFFRLLLAIPHIVWLLLWGIVVFFAAIANWFATLFGGRSPEALHRFLAAYVRYSFHVSAFLYLIGNPFPGFVGRAGSYPVDVEIAPPERQNRWITGFRVLLALPAALMSSAFGSLLAAVALLAWFAALFTGRMPRGLRNAGAAGLRYSAQVSAYGLLLTDRYPYAGPTDAALAEAPAPPPEPAPAPV